MSTAKRRTFWALVVATSAVGALGCEAELGYPANYGYVGANVPLVVSAGVVPPNIYAYPRVFYNGTYVYLAGGRWYYPAAGRFWVYQHEPPGLVQYRTRIYANPAYRGYYRGGYYRGYGYPATRRYYYTR